MSWGPLKQVRWKEVKSGKVFHDKMNAHLYQGSESPTLPLGGFDHDRPIPTTEEERRLPLSPDIIINMVNIGKQASSVTPSPAVSSTIAILFHHDSGTFPFLYREMFQPTDSQDNMANGQDCVNLGILCANVCDALKQGTKGKKLGDLSEPVRDAVNRLEA